MPVSGAARPPTARRPPPMAALAAGAVEVALFEAYRREASLFHWFTHLYAGGAAAAVVGAAVAWRRRRPVGRLWVWVVVGHAIAAFPDVLFRAGVAHQRWMDVFVAHVSSHQIAGREATLLALFLATLALYGVVVDRLRPAAAGGARRTGAETR